MAKNTASLIEVDNCSDDERFADVIFLHGLDGDAVKTWQLNKENKFKSLLKILKKDNKPTEMFWPKWLSSDVPGIGIWSVNYPSASSGWRGKAMSLPDRAANLLQLLSGKSIGSRPIIFITHSLGGLVVKKMLYVADSQDNVSWKPISDSTKGIMFIATPHSGSLTATFINNFSKVYRSTAAIKELEAHHPYLEELSSWFRKFYKKSDIKAHVLTENEGTLGVVVVDSTSGNPFLDGVIPIKVDKDHISISKAESKDDVIYTEVVRFIKDWFSSATGASINKKKLQLIQSENVIEEVISRIKCHFKSSSLSIEELNILLRTSPKQENEYLLNVLARWYERTPQGSELLNTEIRINPGLQLANSERKLDERGIWQLLNEGVRAFVLIGPPGSGKSTQLRLVQFHSVIQRIRNQKGWIPFCISLSDYIPRGSVYPDPHEWIKEQWEKRFPHFYEYENIIESGNLLLLIDGLNEGLSKGSAAIEERCENWRTYIKQYFHEGAGNVVIAACRNSSYVGQLSTQEYPLPIVSLQPLPFELVKDQLESRINTRDLKKKISNSVIELYRNPFLLSLLPKRIQHDGHIPQTRCELFVTHIRVLILREIEAQNPDVKNNELLSQPEIASLVGGQISKNELDLPNGLLFDDTVGELAFNLVTLGTNKVSEAVCFHPLNEVFSSMKNSNVDSAIKLLLAIGVIDTSPEGYRFSHILWQDFFVARYINQRQYLIEQNVPTDCNNELPFLSETIKHLGDIDHIQTAGLFGWEDTMSLCVEMSLDIYSLLKKIASRNIIIASQLLLENKNDVNLLPLISSITSKLESLLRDSSVDLRIRIRAGDLLGSLGDFRLSKLHGGYVLPQLCFINTKECILGHEPSSLDGNSNSRKVLLRPFRLGKWPVTNFEYQQFVNSGGYDNPNYWIDLPGGRQSVVESSINALRNHWSTLRNRARLRKDFLGELVKEDKLSLLQAASISKLASLTDESFENYIEKYVSHLDLNHPAYWNETDFKGQNLPVTGVSWFEAMAYCRWLSEVANLKVRLPTEDEWEYVATNGGVTTYGYGNEFNSNYCNTFESRVGRPTPVGIYNFGDGNIWEVEELTGNIFEWVLDLWAEEVSSSGSNKAEINQRICRGGSFLHTKQRASSCYKGQGVPFVRNKDLGFRVCVDL